MLVKDINSYRTDPASKNAKPHCMKKITMDMTIRKNWSLSFFITSVSMWLLIVSFLRISNCSTKLNELLIPMSWSASILRCSLCDGSQHTDETRNCFAQIVNYWNHDTGEWHNYWYFTGWFKLVYYKNYIKNYIFTFI